ncbi:MmyB family transcriptional regulator [Klebsiella quasipneumoniae]|uniref:MmyB family transcriptional regulator n=1 Tax=Klebsiella quasipneumoniae TaxID=1463165 RepID=UPI000A50423A
MAIFASSTTASRPVLQARIVDWEQQAPLMLSSFRRDFTRASQSTDIPELVNDLERISPAFKLWWRQHQVQAPCHGVRH